MGPDRSRRQRTMEKKKPNRGPTAPGEVKAQLEKDKQVNGERSDRQKKRVKTTHRIKGANKDTPREKKEKRQSIGEKKGPKGKTQKRNSENEKNLPEGPNLSGMW